MWIHQSAVVVNAFDFTHEIKTKCFPRRGERLENQSASDTRAASNGGSRSFLIPYLHLELENNFPRSKTLTSPPEIPGLEPSPSHMLDNCSATQRHLQFPKQFP